MLYAFRWRGDPADDFDTGRNDAAFECVVLGPGEAARVITTADSEIVSSTTPSVAGMDASRLVAELPDSVPVGAPQQWASSTIYAASQYGVGRDNVRT